jgi:hypothetical protein
MRRTVEIHLRRHRPLVPVEADERVANAADRVAGGDRGEHGVVVEDGKIRHGARTIPSPRWSTGARS